MMRTVLSYWRSALPAFGAIVASVAIAACGGDGGEASADVTVVATTTHAADLARNVGGERADVVGLLAPNADPHDYEPRPSDAESVAEADLIVESGGDIDLWFSSLVDGSGTEAQVVTLIDSVETVEGGEDHADEDEHGEEADDAEGDEDEVDPHWWQDPRNAVLAVEEIRDRLVEIDPEGRAEYESNAADYIGRLEELDGHIAGCLRDIPPRQRKLVTSHDSLGYFADRYELEVIGAAIPALSTQAQPSAGETAELVELVRDEGVNAVFPEAGVNSDLEQAIADETGAVVGGELWADTLGPEGSGAETYLEAMTANAGTLLEGLSGGAQACITFPGSE